MLLRQPARLCGRPGQQVEEDGQELLVEREAGRQLPQDGAKLVAERQHAGGEEVGQGGLHVDEPRMWVMKRPPLTANRKSSGTCSAHDVQLLGRWSE